MEATLTVTGSSYVTSDLNYNGGVGAKSALIE